MSTRRRQGDLPSYLNMSPQMQSTAIDLAAEHYAATSFNEKPEILLNQGDTDSQWSMMFQQMMDDTDIPQMDRNFLWKQRSNLAKWIAISAYEIKKLAAKRYPDMPLGAEPPVGLTELRPRGRPPLTEEQKEQAKIARKEDPNLPTMGRPRLTEEEKAHSAALKLGTTDTTRLKKRPVRTGATPGGRQRLVPVVPPLVKVSLEAAQQIGQDPGSQIDIDTYKIMLEKGSITQERFNERMREILGEDWEVLIDVKVPQLPETVVPPKIKREYSPRSRVIDPKFPGSLVDMSLKDAIEIALKRAQEEDAEQEVTEQEVTEQNVDSRLFQ